MRNSEIIEFLQKNYGGSLTSEDFDKHVLIFMDLENITTKDLNPLVVFSLVADSYQTLSALDILMESIKKTRKAILKEIMDSGKDSKTVKTNIKSYKDPSKDDINDGYVMKPYTVDLLLSKGFSQSRIDEINDILKTGDHEKMKEITKELNSFLNNKPNINNNFNDLK